MGSSGIGGKCLAKVLVDMFLFVMSSPFIIAWNYDHRVRADGARFDSEAVDFPYDSVKAVEGISAKERAHRAFGTNLSEYVYYDVSFE